jgi:multidrug efflux system membrane fusion protein
MDQERSRGRRRWWIWISALCILCGGGYLLSQRPSGAQNDGSGKKSKGGGAIPVAATQVKQGDMGVYIVALGQVIPVYTVTIRSRVDGQLMAIYYKEGQIVQKGQLLAVIDPGPYEAALTQAQGQLARDQALLKNALIDLDRYKMIYQQRAIPEQTLATQQALVEQYQGTVKVDEGTLQAAQVQENYTRITAPITGRVGLRLVDPGNIVHATDTNGIVVITQLQPITVEFSIAEDYLSDVMTQMRAGHTLRVDALDRDQQTELSQGTLLTVDNQIDPTTGTVKLRASFANLDNRLFPNQFVNAKLLVRTLRSVNLIPTAAIQRNSQTAFVFVINSNDTVQTRNVTVATSDGNTAAVTGVAPGEKIVTDGFDKLEDGTKISIRQPATARSPAANAGPPQTLPAQGSASTNVSPAQGKSK